MLYQNILLTIASFIKQGKSYKNILRLNKTAYHDFLKYRINHTYYTTAAGVRDTVARYGVAIIPRVINDDECAKMASGMWDWVEKVSSEWVRPILRNDKNTWRGFYDLYPLHSMLIQHHGVGHAQVSWDMRQNPTIVDIFATIWGVSREDLLVSFDGLSFNIPPEDTNKGYFRDIWLHTDQSYTRNDFECLQSWITALDVEEGDATLAILEGSNAYHADCANNFNIKAKDDWYKLNPIEQKFYEDKGCELVRITCPKGSLVLFDSRTIHCGVEAIKGRKNPKFRMIIYLCYLPKPSKPIKKKQKAFAEMRTMSHHPINGRLFAKNPQTYGGALPHITRINPPVLTELGMSLAGF